MCGGGGKWRGGPLIPICPINGIIDGAMKGGGIFVGITGGMAATTRAGGASANN